LNSVVSSPETIETSTTVVGGTIEVLISVVCWFEVNTIVVGTAVGTVFKTVIGTVAVAVGKKVEMTVEILGGAGGGADRVDTS